MSSKTNRNEKANQRRAAIEQIRKEQQAKERRRALLGGAAVGAVLIVLVVLIVIGTRGHHAPAASGPQVLPAAVTGGQPTVEKPAVKVANTTGIPGVVAYATKGWPANGTGTAAQALSHNHVDGPVTYSVTPPVGGDHNGTWMNAGVYTSPIPNERAVHNLEHGAVWITYRPNLPAAQVKALQDFVGKQSLIDEGQYGKNRFMDLSPWASNSLPSPIVISAWGYQLYVTSPTDPRLQQFVNKFRHNQTYSPEFGAAVDGVPVSVGGRAAMYGDTLANPAN
ncbi:MAG: DUF3105 domain-containing protein [Marmoricola sp.]